MNILRGFRTIIFNGIAIITTWLATEYGIELTEGHQTAIITTVVAVINIGLRVITNTPIGNKKGLNKTIKFERLK